MLLHDVFTFQQSVKANTVDILRLYFRRPMMSTLQVPVDDTMTQLTVRLTTPASLPVVMMKNPMGMFMYPAYVGSKRSKRGWQHHGSKRMKRMKANLPLYGNKTTT